jgi:hypothetical protein
VEAKSRALEKWLSTQGVPYKGMALVKAERAHNVAMQARTLLDEFEDSVQAFLDHFGDEMEANKKAFSAGAVDSLFDPSLYPDNEFEAKQMFSGQLVASPITTGDAVAGLIHGEIGKRLAAEAKETHEQALNEAQEALLTEAASLIERLLHVCEAEGQTRVTSSLMEDVDTFVSGAEARLINPDERVTKLVNHIRAALGGLDRKTLAKDKGLRALVAQRLKGLDSNATPPPEPEPEVEEEPPAQPQPEQPQPEPEPEPEVVTAPKPVRSSSRSPFAALSKLR